MSPDTLGPGTTVLVAVLHDAALARVSSLIHGFSERGGGVSSGRFASLNLGPRSGDDPAAARTNRRRFLAALGLGGYRVLAPRQTHSADVAVLRAGDPPPADGVFPGDAVVTDARGVALMVLAADCLPILLFDPVRQVIAAVHAGWRGTAGGIATAAVVAMRWHFGSSPGSLRAALGPAIGRCCYEVGPEVLAAVGAVTPGSPDTLWDALPAGKGKLDLAAANTAQLTAAGLARERIGTLGLCTACHTGRFYSHRRDGEPTGRAGAVIALAAGR